MSYLMMLTHRRKSNLDNWSEDLLLEHIATWGHMIRFAEAIIDDCVRRRMDPPYTLNEGVPYAAFDLKLEADLQIKSLQEVLKVRHITRHIPTSWRETRSCGDE